jgi:hypothetical protein
MSPANLDRLLSGVDLVFLILIWLDGRAVLRSSIRIEQWEGKTHQLYVQWFEERRAERLARQEAAKKAREAKAAKAESKEQSNG